MQQKNIVVSFSYKQLDVKASDAINELRQYGKSRGISFSYLIIQAVTKYLEELNNESR